MELLISLGIAILIFAVLVGVGYVSVWISEEKPDMAAIIGCLIAVLILTALVYSMIKG